MRRPYLWFFALTMGPLATLACANILGFERLDAAGPDASVDAAPVEASAEASIDAGVEADAPFVDPACSSDGVPEPLPDTPDATAGTGFYVAFSSFDLGAGSEGMNLDKRCTISKDILPGGGDNTGSLIIDSLPSLESSFKAADIQKLLTEQGKFGFVLSVAGYNGAPNDTAVNVAMIPATGLLAGGAPTGNSTDRWKVQKHYYSGSRATFQSPFGGAFVRDYVLYARFDVLEVSIPLVPGSPDLLLRLRDVIVTGKLERVDAGLGWVLREGRLGGRWNREEILGGIGSLQYDGKRICENKVFWDFIRPGICAGRDLPAERTSATSASSPCDAVSALAKFETYAVEENVLWEIPGSEDAGPQPFGCAADLVTCPP
jgi:hypothetical protein